MLCILENVPCTLDKSVYYAFGRKNINIYIYIVVVAQLLNRVPLFVTPMDCIIPGFLVLHCLPEFAQIHVH